MRGAFLIVVPCLIQTSLKRFCARQIPVIDEKRSICRQAHVIAETYPASDFRKPNKASGNASSRNELAIFFRELERVFDAVLGCAILYSVI